MKGKCQMKLIFFEFTVVEFQRSNIRQYHGDDSGSYLSQSRLSTESVCCKTIQYSNVFKRQEGFSNVACFVAPCEICADYSAVCWHRIAPQRHSPLINQLSGFWEKQKYLSVTKYIKVQCTHFSEREREKYQPVNLTVKDTQTKDRNVHNRPA